jgi:hypothetical protein
MALCVGACFFPQEADGIVFLSLAGTGSGTLTITRPLHDAPCEAGICSGGLSGADYTTDTDYDRNGPVTLSATADPGSTFVQLSITINDASTFTTTQSSLIIADAGTSLNVTATFDSD